MWRLPDPQSNTPVSEQITEMIRSAIAAGHFLEGEKLPSVRVLAAELRVNPNTVAKVYRDLEREGLVWTRPGSGVRVGEGAKAACSEQRERELRKAFRDLVARARECGLEDQAINELIESILDPHVSEGKP